jgi:2-polyprenyl-3-methyl-5-hydroxy-6-metoxy-1,4-benzoquinol methylase
MNNLDKNVDAYKKEFLYDFDNDIMLKYYPKRIISKMKSGSFLELGLGHGYTINEFLKYVDEYTILEGSKAVIENFKTNNLENSKKIKIIETYFETYDTEEKYDYIVMGFILEHVENPSIILNQYKKYLNKNGKIFIAVPNAESLHRQIGFNAGLLNDLQSLSESDLLLGHCRYYNVEELKQLASDNNMNICSIEGIFLKPFMTSQLESLNLPSNIIDGMLEMGKKYPELSNAILMEIEVE